MGGIKIWKGVLPWGYYLRFVKKRNDTIYERGVEVCRNHRIPSPGKRRHNYFLLGVFSGLILGTLRLSTRPR